MGGDRNRPESVTERQLSGPHDDAGSKALTKSVAQVAQAVEVALAERLR